MICNRFSLEVLILIRGIIIFFMFCFCFLCCQVILSEIYTDPGGTRVVVKELKANASAKEGNDFLQQQGDPYR